MAWTQSGNIKGASGIPGASGASGPQGASGVPGATGPAGPTGATGASGGTGGTGGPGTTTWADIVDKPGAILNYKGTWNASTNTPTLSDSTGSGGDVYRVSVGGSRNLGSGTISWEVGDYAIWSPVTSSWEKADTTDAVSSVAGRTGAVTLTSADLGASGTASSSTFLRGDNTWATPSGITRSVSTITAPTTLAAAANTDYVYFLGASGATIGTPTLPTAVGSSALYTLKNISGSTITYFTTSSETVDGSSSGTGDASYSSVVALLSGDGANNSTVITDSSSLASNWTAGGNAKIITATKKYGTGSISTDGTSGTYLRASAAAANFAMPGDFTIELWVYFNTVPTDNPLFDFRDASNTNNPVMTISPSQKFDFYVGGSAIVTGTTTPVAATWYHVAVCRSGSSVRLFVNGTQEGSTATNSTSIAGVQPTLGARYTNNFNANALWDDVRISKAARYTANFTAPTSALPNNTGTNISTGAVVRLISDSSNWRTV